ncbi:MAG: tetraacyldisaccharide 4'-kinase [Planctomycetota bacterium]
MARAEPSASFLPSGLRWAGPALAALYGLGVTFDRAISRAHFAPITTLCVGNMTVGGTGKTPAVICIARGLVARGRKPAILMRGYKAQGGDEAEEVKAALTGLNVPIVLGSDRHASALKARDMGCDVALLDDGFQHWRLKRDLDIVLVDATNPFGGGAILPHGKLREPIAGLSRAGMIVVTRSDALSSDHERDDLQRELVRLSGSKPICFAQHAPVGVRRVGEGGGEWPLEKLKNARAIAACGIGNPGAFEKTLSTRGVVVLDFKTYDDHHDFTRSDMDSLSKSARETSADFIVVTEKDAVKIEKLNQHCDVPIVALRVEFKIEHDDEFWRVVSEYLQRGDARCGDVMQLHQG